MKRVFTIMCLVLVANFMGSHAKAQDLTSLDGSNYYLIYLDAQIESDYDITPKIVKDYRVNWDATTNPNGAKALYNWTGDGSGYVFNNVTGKGSFGQIGGFLDLSVTTSTWSGLGFCMRDNDANVTTSFPVDYTAVTDDYHFHMAVKSSTSPVKAHHIEMFGSSTGKADFSVGVGSMEAAPNITPNFPTDGSWYVIDIPISQLRTYGWTNRDTFKGNYFVTLSGAPTNNLAMDAIFIYLPAGVNGINDVKADKLNVLVTNKIVEVRNATAPIQVYSVTGSLVKTSKEPIFGVEELAKGAYIIKSGNAVAKVMIK